MPATDNRAWTLVVGLGGLGCRPRKVNVEVGWKGIEHAVSNATTINTRANSTSVNTTT